MQYFITEAQRKQSGGTCYFEFQTGQKNKNYKPIFWKHDSLLLHMDIVDRAELYKIFPDFNYYGITIIPKATWDKIQSNAENESIVIKEIINELRTWAENNFKIFDYFLILGI